MPSAHNNNKTGVNGWGTTRPIESLADRIHRSVVVVGDCWIWKLAVDSDGYPRMKVKGKTVRATWVSLKEFRGITVEKGQQACHTCDTPSCINPNHLFAGTYQENVDDKMRKGRHRGNMKISDEQVIEIRELLGCGVKRQTIMDQFGIKQSQITRIKNGER